MYNFVSGFCLVRIELFKVGGRSKFMDMETYEIDLWEFFELLNTKKTFIIGFICFSLITTFIITYFFIEKQYQSEVWIKLNENFLYKQNDTPYDYLKTYFMNPEITHFTFNDDSQILGGLKDRFSLKKVDSMLKVELTHPFRSDISEILLKWMNATRVKLIIDEGSRVVSTMENEILVNQMIMQNMQYRLDKLNQVLKEENQYVLTEVFPKDVVNPQTFVYKEINPSYTEFKTKVTQIDLEIETIKNQKELLQNILANYRSVLKNIKSSNVFENNAFEDLKKIQTNYLTYLKEIQAIYLTDLNTNFQSASYNSLIPFEIITKPYTTTSPISPNIKLNIAIAGLLALFISVFFVFFLNYLEIVKKEKATKTMNADL